MSTFAAIAIMVSLPLGFATLNTFARSLYRLVTAPPKEPLVTRSEALSDWAIAWRVMRVPLILFCGFFAVAYIHESRTAAPEPQRLVVNHIGDMP